MPRSPLLALGAGALLLSATLAAGAPTVDAAETLTAFSRADTFTQADIDRSPRGYKLAVPGVGKVYITGLRAPDGGRNCRVHKASVIEKLAANPPKPQGITWVQVGILKIPEELGGGFTCFGDGKGCYLIASRD